MKEKKEMKKIIPCIEGGLKEIGSLVGYIFISLSHIHGGKITI
jgi:hypothetical protein